MGGVLAAGWRAISLDESPLLADLRSGRPGWWRLPLGILAGLTAAVLVLSLGLLVIMVGWMLVAGADAVRDGAAQLQAAMGDPELDGFLPNILTVSVLAVVNGIAALVAVTVASLLTRHKLRLSFTTARRWRWRQLFAGVLLGALLLAPLMALDLWRQGEMPKLPLFTATETPVELLIYLVVTVVSLIVAAGAEELAFRGWFLRETAALFRFMPVVLLLNAALFSAMHGDGDPNAFIDRGMAGLGLAYIALRAGGIEFSTGAHAANNLLIVLLIQPLSLQIPPPETYNPLMTLESLLGLSAYIAAIEFALRNRRFSAWMNKN